MLSFINNSLEFPRSPEPLQMYTLAGEFYKIVFWVKFNQVCIQLFFSSLRSLHNFFSYPIGNVCDPILL